MIWFLLVIVVLASLYILGQDGGNVRVLKLPQSPRPELPKPMSPKRR